MTFRLPRAVFLDLDDTILDDTSAVDVCPLIFPIVRLERLRGQGTSVEAAIAEAVRGSLAGRHASAASLVHAALKAAPASSSGWMLPVDPFLHVTAHQDEWAPVLALLRSRAA